MLRDLYRPSGERAFDDDFVRKLFDSRLEIAAVREESELPPDAASCLPLGRNFDGCRIGFNRGGSDHTRAAAHLPRVDAPGASGRAVPDAPCSVFRNKASGGSCPRQASICLLG